jgi:hypothetical protein
MALERLTFESITEGLASSEVGNGPLAHSSCEDHVRHDRLGIEPDLTVSSVQCPGGSLFGDNQVRLPRTRCLGAT